MYNEAINMMKQIGIEFDVGLSDNEITMLQDKYKVIFPESLKRFYKVGLPISKGFYNWRDCRCENIEKIKTAMNKPLLNIIDQIDELDWCDSWGKEIADANIRKEFFLNTVRTAPKLIPFFSHRYIVSGLSENQPILSICGTDIIYYGKNLIDYIYIEFNHEKREFTMKDIEYIPFWSDLI